MSVVTVAIPVRNGGVLFSGTLAALARQSVEHELLVCDSGSLDGSASVARSHGARVLEIEPRQFSHGGTRNLLVSEARGERVALLTQDAEPADERWLERLLGGLELGGDVGIAYGPYRARAHARAAVRIELQRWFESLSPDGAPRVERLGEHERSLPVLQLMGRRGFFTDANACVVRAAWERVPFREIPYAEDRVLAIDMLRAGYAKAYVPQAAVLHSHDYTVGQELRRCFDEWRGLREVYGWREPAAPAHVARKLRGELGAARRELAATPVSATAAAATAAGHASPVERALAAARRRATLVGLTRHHVVRMTGALLGSRAGALPSWARRRLSLERRASFQPLDLDGDTRSDPQSTQDGRA